MDFFFVKNLDKWQHYKNRTPPWIKLHRQILNDYEFTSLPDSEKAHLILIWILASQMDNKIPSDPAWIARKIAATEPVDLNALFQRGFIERYQDASKPLASCKQSAIREAEAEEETEEETETEKEEAPGESAPPPCGKLEGRMAAKLRKMMVEVTSINPVLISWVKDGYTIEQLVEITEIAQKRKPGERIPARYIDAILKGHSNQKPKEKSGNGGDNWTGIGKTLGLKAKRGETMQAYMQRVQVAMGEKSGRKRN